MSSLRSTTTPHVSPPFSTLLCVLGDGLSWTVSMACLPSAFWLILPMGDMGRIVENEMREGSMYLFLWFPHCHRLIPSLDQGHTAPAGRLPLQNQCLWIGSTCNLLSPVDPSVLGVVGNWLPDCHQPWNANLAGSCWFLLALSLKL